MRNVNRFRAVILAAAAVAAAGGSAFANCTNLGGFNIAQCANFAYFEVPPFPVAFDPTGRPQNVMGAFWQVSFGNGFFNPGAPGNGANGTGTNYYSYYPLPYYPYFFNGLVFIGNDSGNVRSDGTPAVDIKEAQAATGNPMVPFGALCLSSNNFGNSGVDGCCDNDRALIPSGKDDLLNPLFQVAFANSTPSHRGHFSTRFVSDAPLGVLLKQVGPTGMPDDNPFFGLAGVSSTNRGSTGNVNGCCDCCLWTSPDPSACIAAGIRCDPAAGGQGCFSATGTLCGSATVTCATATRIKHQNTNPAACDFTAGEFNLKGVQNGNSNPASGANNAIPWQMTPKARVSCVGNCSGAGPRDVELCWDVVRWFHDGSVMPSVNPQVGGVREQGMGILDFLRETAVDSANDPNLRWNGLVRYDVQQATAVLDPTNNVDYGALSFFDVFVDIAQPPTDTTSGDPTASQICMSQILGGPMQVNPGECLRIKAKFGTKPEVPSWPPTGPVLDGDCRVGKCGDVGFEVSSRAPFQVTCLGGGLISESAELHARKLAGKIQVTWTTTAESSIQGFNLYAKTAKGEKLINSSPIACEQCITGIGASYEQTLTSASIRGAKELRLEVLSASNPFSVTAPIE